MTKKSFSRSRRICGGSRAVAFVKRRASRKVRRHARRILEQAVEEPEETDIPPIYVTGAWEIS